MSNLLEKASIVTTPTAYDNGKILSVKPAPSLGSELVVNGTFDSNINFWNKGGGNVNPLSWDNEKIKITNDVAQLNSARQTITTQIGKTYKVSADVNSVNGLTPRLASSNPTTAVIGTLGTIETLTYTFIATSTSSQIELFNWQNTVGKYNLWDNVSVKELIDGDFDFTRNSSATRVNSQGLIEDVQILSSNLVTNGDFSQEGSEQITNGDFATDSNWTKGTGWSISGGVANCDGTNAALLFQSLSGTTTNDTFKVTYTISDYISGSVFVGFGSGLSQPNGTTRNANGTYTEYLTKTSVSTSFGFKSISFIGSIDNVSVKEVGQDWTLGTGWSIGANQLVRAVAVSGSYAQTSYDLGVIGRLYKISINVTEVLSGTLYVYGGLGGTPALTITSAGVYTINHIWASDQPLGVFCNNSFTGSISNISVIEITDDTNLPRIDYTGGVGHWLFEPQSTNRMTTSEPTSGGAGFTFPAKTWANGLINGLNATEASSGTKYWYMSSGIANEYSTFSFFVEMEDGSEPIIGNSSDANSDFVVTVKGWFMAESNITKTNTIGNVWKIEAPSRVNELAGTGPIGILKYSGQSNKTFSATGFQIEQSSFATSYIPTSGSTVTRLQDAAFGAGSSDLINSTEGVLYAEIAALANDGVSRVISINDGTTSANNSIVFSYSQATNRLDVNGKVGGSYQFIFNRTIADTTINHKFAVVWKINRFELWVDGLMTDQDLSGSVNSLNTFSKLQLSNPNTTNPLFGKTKCLAVFKEALTDAELTCLTTI